MRRFSNVDRIFGWRSDLETYARRVADGHIPGDITKILDPDTLDALLPYFQTDHLNSRLCDDPINFYLLFSTANGKFGFESLMNYKKEITGPAWAGVVYYVNCAVELQGRLYRA